MLKRTTDNAKSVKAAEAFLRRAAKLLRSPREDAEGGLRFGVDLGTATVVLTAVDEAGSPVYWDFAHCNAVRDGVVVNFSDAVDAVRKLKAEAEAALGLEVEAAATAFPPNVPEAEARACRFVLENAGIECRVLTDEVSAAQMLLRLSDAVIVDVGGGSTGVGIVQNGKIVLLDDRPGGGHHLDLIVAGALKVSVEEAEEIKRTGRKDLTAILRPGIERIAASIQSQVGGRTVSSVHLVGGAVRVPKADEIVERFLNIPTVAYPHSELVTPFGIALS